MKNINIENIDDTLYFKAVELKAKLHAETWPEFLRRVIELYNAKGGSDA